MIFNSGRPTINRPERKELIPKPETSETLQMPSTQPEELKEGPVVTELGQLVNSNFPVQHFVSFEELKSANKRLSFMCPETFWNTIKSTTQILDDGGTFVFTGDIDDLWVRDSCAQVEFAIISLNHLGPSLCATCED